MPDIEEKQVALATVNVTVTTTTEAVAVSSGPVPMNRPTARVLIKGWLQLTTGTATTAVTARIRRGTAITGSLVGEATAITVGAAAGSNEQFQIMVVEERAGENTVEYSLTVQQTDATGNGTVLQAAIEVEVLSG